MEENKRKRRDFMKRERTMKRSLIVLAIMTIMLFAMTITASAAGSVTKLRQTSASNSGVKVAWNANPGQEYRVYYSKSKNSGYVEDTSYTTSVSEWYISGLSAGTTYYVKVASYVEDKNWNEIYVATSAPIQVVTTPENVSSSSIKQTAGTSKTVTVKWTGVAGATGYRVEIEGKTGTKARVVTGTKASMPASSGRGYTVTVKPYRKSSSGFIAMDSSGTWAYGIYAAPVNPQNLAVARKDNLDWDPNESNEVKIGWDRNSFYSSAGESTPDGYQVQMCALDGRTSLYVGMATSYSCQVKVTSLKARKAIKNKGFKVRIRTYIKTDSGVAIWSAWSPFKVVVPQAYLNLNKMKVVNHTGAKLVWTGVANAQYYYVYFNRNTYGTNGGTWRKVKVSASARSYVITGLTKYQSFGFYVVPVCKVDGKLYPATTKNYYTTYIKTVYY